MAEHELDAHSQLIESLKKQRRASDLDLRGTKLAGDDLSGLSADRLDLSGADLCRARLPQARLRSCRLEAAAFEDADWSGATARLCTLDGARGAGARFDGARLEDCSAKGADLARASLRGARLSETSFARAVLRDAVLDGSQGEGVEFRGADLVRATLRGAQLDDADFRGADLTGADLSGGCFRSADFRGALLDGASFDDADCADARFDEGCRPNARNAADDAAEKDAALDQATLHFLAGLTTELPPEFAAGGDALRDLLAQLQRVAADLGRCGNEPPEAWKPWLEPLMQKMGENFSFEEMVAALRSIKPEDLKTWFEGRASGGSDAERKSEDAS